MKTLTKNFLVSLIVTVIIAVAMTAQADQLKVAEKYSFRTNPDFGKFEDVPLIKSRTLKSPDDSIELQGAGIGLRKKAVFGLVPVRVYVLQVLAAKPEKLVRTEDGFLASLKEAGPVQLKISFLRDLPGDKIADSFKEGLEVNGMKKKDWPDELKQIVDYISKISKFQTGDVFSFTALWKDKDVTLLIEDQKDIKMITGPADTARAIFSIWFGKPSDAKLGELKKEIVKY